MQISTSSVTRCGGKGGGEIVACIKQSVGSCPCGGGRGKRCAFAGLYVSPRRAPRFVYKGVVHDSKRHLEFSRVGRIFFHEGRESKEVEASFDRLLNEEGGTTDDPGLVIWYSKFVLFSVFISPHCVGHRWKFKTPGIDIHPFPSLSLSLPSSPAWSGVI